MIWASLHSAEILRFQQMLCTAIRIRAQGLCWNDRLEAACNDPRGPQARPGPDKAQWAHAQVLGWAWASLCARQLKSSSRPGEHRHLVALVGSRRIQATCPHVGVSGHLGAVHAPPPPACRESAPVVRAPARLPWLSKPQGPLPAGASATQGGAHPSFNTCKAMHSCPFPLKAQAECSDPAQSF